MQIKRMTTIGTAANATISPDGKYIVHSIRRDGKTSLWVRQVATTSNVEIVPPEVTEVLGTTFSNDGNYVYYVLRGQRNPDGSLFVVPVLGGTPKKVLTNIRTPIALSPDGRQCAFVRTNNENKAEERLVISNVNDSGERKLASRFGEEFFIPNDDGPSWSSDGKHIATCIGTTKGGFQCRVAVYSVDDGHEEFISPVSWPNLGRVAWLHDGTGIVLTARDSTDVRSQLWHLSFPGGQVRHITNDLNSYGTTSLSLTSDDQALVSVQTELLSDIWAIPDGNIAQGKRLTSGARTLDGNSGLSLTPDGRRIVYSSAASGNNDIWIMDDDGVNQKQLTTDSRNDIAPTVTSDGKAILFASARSGTSNIWMMDLEGSNLKQITTTEDYYATSSPDGKWVVYFGYGSGYAAIWKVAMNGGNPQQLTWKTSTIPAVSHDSRFVACIYVDKPNEWGKIAILSIDGGEPVKLLDLPATAERGVLWSSDGKSILYLNTIGGVSNVWSQPIGGSPPKRVTNFTEGQIFVAAFTTDGKKLVCSRGSTVSDVVLITGFR
jgi:Tol biopolymer transport system component